MTGPVLPPLNGDTHDRPIIPGGVHTSGYRHHSTGGTGLTPANSGAMLTDKWEVSSAVLDQVAPPSLAMQDESFVCTTVADFSWTVLCHHVQHQKAFRVTSSALASTQFTFRHFKLVDQPARTREGTALLVADCKNVTQAASMGDTRQPCNLVEIFLSRAIQLEAQNRSDYSEWSRRPILQCQYAVEVCDVGANSPTTVSSSASRAKSPASKGRSPRQLSGHQGGGCGRIPGRPSAVISERTPSSDSAFGRGGTACCCCGSASADDHPKSRRQVPAPQLSPATFSVTEDPNRINIHVQGASPGDLNELRWLLASFDRLDGACVFTQMVERRDVKHFHVVTEAATGSLEASPRGQQRRTSRATSNSSWPPEGTGGNAVPRTGSVGDSGSNKTSALAVTGADVSSSGCTAVSGPSNAGAAQPHCFKLMHPWHACWKWLGCLLENGATTMNEIAAAYLAAVGLSWAPFPEMIEASWIYELNAYCQQRAVALLPESQRQITASSTIPKEQMVVDSLQKGFEGFLLDVVAFWRGMSDPLEHTNRLSTTANDLAAMAALELKWKASKRCGNLWILGQIPVGALVKGCWDIVKWRRRSWLPSVTNDMTVIIPNKLSTVNFMFKADGLNSTQAQERMFVNGYNCYVVEDLDRFKLGVSTAGLLLGSNFFLLDIMEKNGRQQNNWLFDVDRGFTLGGSNLNILFIASHGANIRASYDEGFAKMIFTGPYPFGAIAEWPRACYAAVDSRRQHEIVFSIEHPLDKRGSGVFDLLNALRRHGGLLHLQCTSVRYALAPSESPDALIPQLPRFQSAVLSHPLASTSGSARNYQKSQSPGPPLLSPVIGYIHADTVTPGRYSVESLPSVQHPQDAAKVRFCKYLLRREDDIEVYGPDRLAPRMAPEIETEAVSFADGIAISIIDMKLGSTGNSGDTCS